MNYIFDSIRTLAYWRYAIFSLNGARSAFAWFGSIYLLIEVLDFFGAYRRDQYAPYAVLLFAFVALLLSVIMRRPTSSVIYRVPNKDCLIEVKIGDLFDQEGAIVISANTTFDTDVAGGVIAPASLQGQVEARYFLGRHDDLEDQIEEGLSEFQSTEREKAIKKTSEFPMGTTVQVNSHGKTFYFCAMARLNEKGNASTTPQDLDDSLEGLWKHVRESGELQKLNIPVMGTGRGRLRPGRQKVIELIAQSFVSASVERVFIQHLTIVVHPSDAKNFDINLWEIRDHLDRALVI